MLFEVTQKKKELDLSVIKGGIDTGQATICADCALCGSSGNDNRFTADKSA